MKDSRKHIVSSEAESSAWRVVRKRGIEDDVFSFEHVTTSRRTHLDGSSSEHHSGRALEPCDLNSFSIDELKATLQRMLRALDQPALVRVPSTLKEDVQRGGA